MPVILVFALLLSTASAVLADPNLVKREGPVCGAGYKPAPEGAVCCSAAGYYCMGATHYCTSNSKCCSKGGTCSGDGIIISSTYYSPTSSFAVSYTATSTSSANSYSATGTSIPPGYVPCGANSMPAGSVCCADIDRYCHANTYCMTGESKGYCCKNGKVCGKGGVVISDATSTNTYASSTVSSYSSYTSTSAYTISKTTKATGTPPIATYTGAAAVEGAPGMVVGVFAALVGYLGGRYL